MEKKEDRRITMTKRMLKDALIEILQEKDIYHVSVRELCDKADVNRTTFYKYYGNQFELLTDMEKDMLDYLSQTVKKNEEDQEKIVSSACAYLEKNLEFARMIFNNNVDPDFARKLFALESVKASTLKKYYDSKNETELEYIYNFLTYGIFRLIHVWLNKEMRESPEEFARMVMRLLMKD